MNYYDIGKDLNWESIIAIREDLEDDLKEYVDEIISMPVSYTHLTLPTN